MAERQAYRAEPGLAGGHAARANLADLRLRPIADSDSPFLRRLYAESRSDEMRLVPWSEQEKADFLQMQFDAQHNHYLAHYGDGRFDVIELAGESVGRLYVDRRAAEIRIIDIAVLRQYRRRGIGGQLLGDLLAEAVTHGRFISIHVEMNNPALSLYRRLGFKEVRSNGVYLYMEWHA